MFDESEETSPMSFWPSVSDLFMTLFVVALVLVAAFLYVTPPVSPDADQALVMEQLGGIHLPKIRDPANQMRRALGTLPEIPDGAPASVVVGALAVTADGASSG